MPSAYEKLAVRLKELRNLHGVTQEEFSSIADFSYKFYQQIESGRKKHIRLDTVERLADAYQIDVSEILNKEFPEHSKLRKKKKSSSIHYKPRKK